LRRTRAARAPRRFGIGVRQALRLCERGFLVSAESHFLEPWTAGLADYGRAWGQAKSLTSDKAANEIKSLITDSVEQSQGVGQVGESASQIRLTHGEAAR